MISGAHVVVFSKDADKDRAFLRDVIGLPWIDAGHGWLIFALPPSEVALHPSDEKNVHELYLMCDDLKAELSSLAKKGVQCSEVEEAAWGSITQIPLPAGPRCVFISRNIHSLVPGHEMRHATNWKPKSNV